MNLKKRYFFYSFIVIAIFLPSILFSQNEPYLGGKGNGNSSVEAMLANCNVSRFSGGKGNGTNSLVLLFANCDISRFAGSKGSGYSSNIYIWPRTFLGNDTSITIICASERVNLLSLYNIQGITIAWNTPLPGAVPAGNYRAVGTNTQGCTDTVFAMVKQEIAIWRGAISTDWHTAANWNNNRIPDLTTHVIIPGGTANPCIISTANANAASVQGRINGNFSILNNRKLFIEGNCAQLPTGQ